METVQTDVIKTAVVEDMRDIRDGLTTLINFTEGFRCTGSYRSMEEALARLSDEVPDVLLSDIGLPGMSGIDGIKIIKDRYPEMQILMLTVYDDDDRIFEAICAGACGYLLKKTPPARLLESVREAYNGGAPMSPSIARMVINSMHKRQTHRNPYGLTGRETDVLTSLSKGNSYKLIASEFDISIDTVRTHIKNIYGKLQVHSQIEAVSKAMNEKLI